MNDMTILHLSDLHIDGSNSGYSRLLENLIEDIKKEIAYIKDNSLVLIVTGDIIHKGPRYTENSKAVENAKSFFTDLYAALSKKIAGIYMVPGNHDKYRSDNDKFLIPAYRTMINEFLNVNENNKEENKTKFDNTFYETFWPFHLESYNERKGSGYLELTKEIYKIFGLSEETINSKSFINETFGVDIIKINNKNFCFVLLNTSWSCLDDNDNRNIVLGKFQIDKIKDQYNNLVNKHKGPNAPIITIALGHHPLSCLRGNEEDRIFTEMISFDSFEANVYLSGHTHHRTVNNWVNNRHSVNTFVTGIGWPENSSGQHVGDHTYSMYVFNLNANSIDVYVRNTNDGGEFFPDFKIYTNKFDRAIKKLVYPIKAHEAQTYIPLSVGNNRSAKAYYVSKGFMEYVKLFVKKIEKFRAVVGSIVEQDKYDFYNNVCSSIPSEKKEAKNALYNYLFAKLDNKDEDILSEINDIFKKNSNLIFEMLLSFLQHICQKMQQIFVEDICDKNDIVRFHFRYLSDKNCYQYLRLCASFPENIDSCKYDVSEIKYGQLIEKSYESGCSLIYSINEEFTERPLSEKWKNFITVVPVFEKNNYTRKYVTKNKKYPYITFGITTNNDKFDELLYCMDYFSIKETLEEIIDQFLELFMVDINQFCNWAKKYLEQGADKNE